MPKNEQELMEELKGHLTEAFLMKLKLDGGELADGFWSIPDSVLRYALKQFIESGLEASRKTKGGG